MIIVKLKNIIFIGKNSRLLFHSPGKTFLKIPQIVMENVRESQGTLFSMNPPTELPNFGHFL